MNNECYLVFKTAETPFAKKWLKQGFGHVYLLINDKFNWMLLDATRSRLHIEILEYSPDENLAKKLKNNYPHMTVLKIRTINRQQPFQYRCFRTLSCVSIVCYYLGLPWNIFTPWQLYKYLIKKDWTYDKSILNVHAII